MNSLAALIVERGVATFEEVELAIGSMLLLGGDLGTNLVDSGVLQENTLQRLLSEYHGMPIGPPGQLPLYGSELEDLLPKEMARRAHVHPVKRTERILHLAVCGPLDLETETQLRHQVGLELHIEVVAPFRLIEAISRSCDVPLTERNQRLLDQLEVGSKREPAQQQKTDRPVAAMFGATAPYRRMAERADGVVPSEQQPKPRLSRAAARLIESVSPPETLDGVGPAETAPRSPESGGIVIVTEPPPTTAKPKRITQPWAEDEEEGDGEGTEGAEDEEGEVKRNTQPWRDDAEAVDELPLSIRGEFDAQLSEAPPSEEAKISEDHRSFRHRGPFTRAQAELAISQAPDVQAVLEILVRYARQFFERCVLLVVRSDQAQLRLSYGLTADRASFAVSLAEPSLFNEAVVSGDPVVRPFGATGLDARIKHELTAGDEPVAVIPLQIRERIVSLFYGDDRADGVDKDAVADVTDFTEICAHEITRIIIRLKRRGR